MDAQFADPTTVRAAIQALCTSGDQQANTFLLAYQESEHAWSSSLQVPTHLPHG